MPLTYMDESTSTRRTIPAPGKQPTPKKKYKLLSIYHKQPKNKQPVARPKSPESVTILSPEPSRPHLLDQPEGAFERSDYDTLLDKSRALIKFTTKSTPSELELPEAEAEAEPKNDAQTVRTFSKRGLYRLHCISKPTRFNPPPPLRAIQIGEVKRTYGKAVKKNPARASTEHVEVKVECDPGLLLDTIGENAAVKEEAEEAECQSFQFIDVKQEPDIYDGDAYISD